MSKNTGIASGRVALADAAARRTVDRSAEPEAQVSPPDRRQHHTSGCRQLESRPQAHEIGRGRDDHHPERGEQDHRHGDRRRSFV
jgi:hypothetical protein